MKNIIKAIDLSLNNNVDALWYRFVKYFWILVAIHLFAKVIPAMAMTDDQVMFFWGIAMVVNIVSALGMVINVGLHSCLISQKKSYMLFGLLGLWWFSFIGIFLSFIAVNWVYRKTIGKKLSIWMTLVAIVLGGLSLFAIYIMI